MNFQGRLLTAAGAVVADGNYNMEFKIYKNGPGNVANDTGGTLLWTEDWLNNNSVVTSTVPIVVKNGYFSAQLGTVNALPSTATLDESVLWLSMTVAGGAGATSTSCTTFSACNASSEPEMLPMKSLGAAPYAINAANANALGGLTSGQYVQLAQGSVQAASSSTNPAIYINETSTANILTLQSGGTDAFDVTSAGNLLFGNGSDKTVGVAQSAGGTAGHALSITAGQGGTGTGSAGGALTLQGGAGGGTTAGGGNVVVDAGAAAGASTNGSILIGGSVDATVTVGKSNGAQTLTFGQSTTGQNINIGHATVTSTQNISIGDSASGSGKDVIAIGNTNTGSSLAINAGSGNATVNTTSGNLTLSTTTSGILAVTSAAALNLTGAANSTWDIGSAHTLSIQTTGNGAITTGSGLLTDGGNLTVQGTTTTLGTAASNSFVSFANTSTNATVNFANAATATGGTLFMTGQTAGGTANNGGAVTIQGGAGTTTGTGGLLTLQGGNSAASGTNGGVTIDTGTGGTTAGTIGVGNSAIAHTISIGSSNSANQGVTVGSTSSGSTLLLQGGSGASAINLEAASGGTISIGTSNNDTVNVGNSVAPSFVNKWNANSTAGYPTISSFSPTTAGDVMVVAIKTVAGNKVTSVTGGDVSAWHYVTYNNGNVHEELWYGTITSTSATTLTFSSISGSPCTVGTSCEILAEEFTAGLGAGTNWFVTTSAVATSGASTTINYPSLKATVANGLYWGYAYSGGTASAGATSGFTYFTTPLNNEVVYNPTMVSGTTYTPQATNTNSVYDSLGMILVASTSNLNEVGTSQLNGAITSPVVFANSADSASAFQIQNASGANAFLVDNTNSLVKSSDTLQVGPGSPGTTTPKFLYLSDVSSNSSGNPLIVGQWSSSGNWGIGPNSNASDSTLRIGATTANGVNTWSTTQNTNLLVAGTEKVQPTTGNDSTSALQVQNAAGTSTLLDVDTVNGGVAVGATSATAARLSVVGATADNTTNALSLKNVAGSTLAQFGDDGSVSLGLGAAATTMGYTSIGASQSSSTASQLGAQQFTAPATGVATSLTAYLAAGGVDATNKSFQMAIYTDNGSNVPNTYVASTGIGTLSTAGAWYTLPLTTSTPTLTAGTKYWLVYWSNITVNNSNNSLSFDTVSGFNYYTGTQTWQTGTNNGLPTTFPAGSPVSNHEASFYASMNGTSPAVSISSTGALTATGASVFQDVTNSMTALQVQNSVAANVLNIDTTSTDTAGGVVNYLAYPGFESGSVSNAAAGWTNVAPATVARNSSQLNVYDGASSIQVTPTTAANGGITTSSFYGGNAPPAQAYIVSFYAKLTAGTSMPATAFTVSVTGTSTQTCTPLAGVTLSATSVGFQRISCQVAATSAAVTSMKIIQNDTPASGRTIYIDDAQMQDTSFGGSTISSPTAFQNGAVAIAGILESPLAVESVSDSSTALQVVNAEGSQILAVDTIANDTTAVLSVGSATGANTQVGIQGNSGTNAGLIGSSSTGDGIYGQNTASSGVTGYGVHGASLSGTSGYFQSSGSTNTAATLVVQQNGSQSNTLLQVMQSGGSTLLGVTSAGATTIVTPNQASSATNGTSAPTTLAVTGGVGGATTNSGFTAGNGSGISLQAGNGGTAVSGSTNGNGGSITLSAGTAGGGAGTAGSAGQVLVKNQSNSSSGFQIQNAGGANTLVNVDSNNVNLTSSSLSTVASAHEWSVLTSTNISTPGSATDTWTNGVSPHTIGNVMVLAIGLPTTSISANSVTGGGVTTWTKINANNLSTTNRVELWYGVVTSTGVSTVTVNFSGTDSVSTELVNQEFTAGLGSGTSWAVTTSNVASNGAASNITFPSLTSGSTAGGMYVGYGLQASGNSSAGTTSGFSYEPTPVAADMYLYNPSLAASTAYQPVAALSTSATSNVVGAILTATADSTLSANGSTIVGGGASQTAFAVQGSSGTSLFNVDSNNNIISLATGQNGSISPWQPNSNSMPNIMGTGAAVAANGYVFNESGNNNSTVDGRVYSAELNGDGTVGPWTSLSSLPTTPVKFQATTAVGGYLYELGGTNNGGTDQSAVQYAQINADGTLGTWNTTTALGATVSRATAVTANGYIYVIGGVQAGSNSTNVYYGKVNADGTVTTWNTGGVLTAATRDLRAVYTNGYIIVLGGGDGTSSFTTVQTSAVNASTGANGAFSTTGDAVLPGARAQATAAVINGVVYVVGGRSADNTNSPQGTTYYGSLNSLGQIGAWNTTPTANSLPVGVFGQSMVAVNGYMIVMGGFNVNGTLVNNVASTTTPRVLVNASLDLVGSSAGDLDDGGDGSTGSSSGTLTAGNTNVVGSLQVTNQANFGESVAVNGNLVDFGSALVKTSGNSASALQVQDTNGNSVLNVDTSNVKVTVATAAAGGQFTNNGSFLSTAKNLGNFSSSTSIGAANVTVDVYTSFVIPQTSGSISVTIPNPTDATAGRLIFIANTGSTSMTVAGITLANGGSMELFWNGTAWTTTAVSTGVTIVGAFSGSAQTNGASISGNTITFGPASSSVPGMVSTGTQTFGGAKTIQVTSANAFVVQSTGPVNMFNVDTSAEKVTIGPSAGDTTGAQLIVGNKTNSGDPASPVAGAIYYNTGGTGGPTTGEFRCYQGGAWRDCLGMQDVSQRRWGYRNTLLSGTAALQNIGMQTEGYNYVGTAGTTALSQQTESEYVVMPDTATAGNSATFSPTNAGTFDTNSQYLPKLESRIRVDTTSVSGGTRYWVGFSSANAPPAADPTTTSASSVLKIAMLGYRDGVNSGKWICEAANGSNVTGVDTGVTVTAGHYYDVIIDMSVSGNLTCSVADNGGAYSTPTTLTTAPSGSNSMYIDTAVTSVNAVARQIMVAYQYFEYQ